MSKQKAPFQIIELGTPASFLIEKMVMENGFSTGLPLNEPVKLTGSDDSIVYVVYRKDNLFLWIDEQQSPSLS